MTPSRPSEVTFRNPIHSIIVISGDRGLTVTAEASHTRIRCMFSIGFRVMLYEVFTLKGVGL